MMGLFSKKDCSLCGGKVGLLDPKLADGHLCKACKQKLSPWFDGYKETTAAQIEEQMRAREENRKLLDSLSVSAIYGNKGVILIDEENRKFVALSDTSDGLFKSAKQVTSLADVIEKNPDIISFDQVRDVDIDIVVNSAEDKRTVDGKTVSYDPPHMRYMCSFTVRIAVDHPYIHSVYVPLESAAVIIKTEGRRLTSGLRQRLAEMAAGLPRIQDEGRVFLDDSALQSFLHSQYELPDYAYGFKVSFLNQMQIREYEYYLAMANTIRDILMGDKENQ